MVQMSSLKKISLFGVGLITLAVSSSAPAKASVAWPQNQDPTKFLFLDEKLETHFDRLRLRGAVNEKDGHAPWAETYWPGRLGGIAFRYQIPTPRKKDTTAFTDVHYSLDALKRMSPEQIRLLSPAEKLDIINGDYDYPLTRRVLNTYGKDTPSWAGICHGWGPAAANYPEPQNTEITNRDGIRVQVGSGDMKALISYYYAWVASQYDDQDEENFTFENRNGVSQFVPRNPEIVSFIYRGIGERCVRGEGTCGKRGLNPAAFHLALTNVIGNYQRSFVANVVTNMQIWNQPAYGYESQVLEVKDVRPHMSARDRTNPFASPSVVKKVLVHTKFIYVQEPEDSPPSYSPRGEPAFNKNQTLADKDLTYWLDLDIDGNIVGGDWTSGFLRGGNRKSESMGFIWRASRVPFMGKFKALNMLYVPAVKKTTSYATSRNYTPGLEDTYFEVNSSSFPEFDWSIVSQ